MSAEDGVRNAEANRCTAMLAGDVAALDALLSENLTFVHATGAVDGKAVFLQKVAAAAILYHSIDWTEPQIDVLGGIVAMHGIMMLEVTVAGVVKILHNRVIMLWEAEGGAWRLRYFQSTPSIQKY